MEHSHLSPPYSGFNSSALGKLPPTTSLKSSLPSFLTYAETKVPLSERRVWKYPTLEAKDIDALADRVFESFVAVEEEEQHKLRKELLVGNNLFQVLVAMFPDNFCWNKEVELN